MNPVKGGVVFGCLVWLLLGAGVASAQVIGNYEELFALLPGGADAMAVHRPVIEEAQRRVAERQMLRRKRSVTFVRPVRYDVMNEKYVSVAFEARIAPRKKAVFAVLFETGPEQTLMFMNEVYLSWIGHNDLSAFDGMSINALYTNYQQMGVTDCTPGFRRTGVEKALIAKADLRHTHSADAIVSGVLPASVMPAGYVRSDEMKKNVAEATRALETKIARLEKTVARLSALLDGVSRKDDTLLFSNMNVQIVNGRGATHQTNGRGNLIVGYNESRGVDARDGSHNIVVGSKNDYSSYGGIVTGFNNDIGGKYANVIGGNNNQATGDYASITGGAGNRAQGKYAGIHGQSSRTKVDVADNPHFQ
ncbi:hypothetical protein JCM14469_29430 [Desulfatiferula olefinivorans]